MEILKAFFKSKQGQRALWTMLNTLMSMAVGILTFAATDNIAWAVMILPFVQAISQYITKEYVNPKIN
jgi:hypothetical protein